jgi:hypothetical protein
MAINNPTMRMLYQGTPLAETELYLNPLTSGAALVKQIVIANPTTLAKTYSVSVVAGGGAGDPTNRIIGDVAIGPKDVATFDGFIVIEPGDSISGIVAAGVVLTIFGVVSD